MIYSQSRRFCPARVFILLTLVLALPLAAQESERVCTVGILNQTVYVQPDDTWVLPDIPANMGPVRARMTCVENGVTTSGASDYFTIKPDRMNAIPKIVIGQEAPAPTVVELTAPRTTLAQVGETLQLTVNAIYADGEVADVSSAASGTTYRSTNEATASVGPGGLVTAHRSGRVLVTVLHDAVVDTVVIDVLVSGDSDGDGLPDDFEVANGLDPNNPADALEDADGDGLTHRQEFELGLDLFDPDSDGDGLLDGDETTTDPRLFDTDGDFVSDGLEVLAGSDPLDPSSVDLEPILDSIEVFPTSFTITFDTVAGEASRQLEVRGTLIDGSRIDITAGPYGTQYSSADLTIASFGAEAGRVFAGQSGSTTVTASNGGRGATTFVQVETFVPLALAFLSLPGYPNGVAVEEDHAYVAVGSRGLMVVDVFDLGRPFIAGSHQTPGNANDVRVSDGLAYVADGAAGLQIFDVSTPSAPSLVGTIDTAGDATDLAVEGSLVLIADGGAGVAVIDATDPTNPSLLASLDTPGRARGIDVADGWSVVADSTGGVHVIDISTPTAPVLMGSVHTRSSTSSRAADVAVRDRLAYVADGSDSVLGGLRIIDFSVPENPVVVSTTGNRFGLTGVALDGPFALSSDYFFVNSVPIFDIGRGVAAFSQELDFSRTPSFRDDNGNGVAVRNGAIFLAGTRRSIRDNGTWGSGGLHIGRYRSERDSEGQAPRIELLAPLDGEEVRERELLVLRAEASDDIRVARVDFLIDDSLLGERVVGTDFRRPWEARLSVPRGIDELVIRARASDLADNRAETEPLTLSVTPDASPTVRLLSPSEGLPLVEGGELVIAAEASDDVQVSQVEIFVDGTSRRVLGSPPFRYQTTIPLGATQAVVEVVATDDLGQTASTGERLFAVADDRPPEVTILSPTPAQDLIEGARLRILAGAEDDVRVRRVFFRVGGTSYGSDSTAPYESAEIVVPSAGASLVLAAEAEDDLGQSTTAEVTLVAIPDPGTTFEGRVLLPEGDPAAGAEVSAATVVGTTDLDGHFTLTGVPTVLGDLSVRAQLSREGETLVGASEVGAAIPEAVLDVGDIVLESRAAVGYYSLTFNRGDFDQRRPIEAAGLEPVDVGSLYTADLAQIDILFAQNASNSSYSSAWRSNEQKIADFVAAGGILVFHDRRVTGAGTYLPGSPTGFVRNFGDDSDVDLLDPLGPLAGGPGGELDDSSLDGGNSSSHGYVVASLAPAGSLPQLSRSNDDEWVTFAYPHGQGWVVYSTIPLDFYLDGRGPTSVRLNMRDIYAPNVLSWARSLP